MHSDRIITYWKQWIPPRILTALRKRNKLGWKGDFKNWELAASITSTYDNTDILEKAKLALMKVKNGEAVYERDTVLFDKIEYSWPLLSALLWISNLNNGSLKVCDFGGSLGSSYFQNRLFLNSIRHLQWNIIEQKSFVAAGQQFFQDNILHFFYSAEDLLEKQGLPDILILSCVLPYIEKPYDLLRDLMRFRIHYLLIDNTYFNYDHRDRICIQQVPPEIYRASYPCWMLDVDHVKNTLSASYELLSSHINDSYIYLDGKKIQYQGFLFKIKE